MIRRPPRSTQSRSSAASDVYKRQDLEGAALDAVDEYFLELRRRVDVDLAHKDHHTDVAAERLVAHAELRPLLHARLLPSSAATTPGRRPGACDPLVSAAVGR